MKTGHDKSSRTPRQFRMEFDASGWIADLALNREERMASGPNVPNQVQEGTIASLSLQAYAADTP
jgi:hypothetical protein